MRITTILFAFTITGCALDQAEVETSTTRAALADWGYTSCDEWGIFQDEWNAETAFSEESFAFAEICGDGDPFGGSGGGGGGGDPTDPGVCSVYNGQVSGSSSADGRSTVNSAEGPEAYQNAYERAAASARRNAGNQAVSIARSNCRTRLYPAGVGVCRGRDNAGFGGSTDAGCYWKGAEYPENSNTVVIAECRAEAAVDCEFEWSLY